MTTENISAQLDRLADDIRAAGARRQSPEKRVYMTECHPPPQRWRIPLSPAALILGLECLADIRWDPESSARTFVNGTVDEHLFTTFATRRLSPLKRHPPLRQGRTSHLRARRTRWRNSAHIESFSGQCAPQSRPLCAVFLYRNAIRSRCGTASHPRLRQARIPPAPAAGARSARHPEVTGTAAEAARGRSRRAHAC